MQQKKRGFFISLTLLFLLVLVACSSGDASTGDPTAEPPPAATGTPVTDMDDMETIEIRFAYYSDGNEGMVMQELLDKFEAANPGIKVVLDIVPYQTIDEQLPDQVANGEGPDLARITNFGAFRGHLLDMRPYLDNPNYFGGVFPGPVLAAMRDENNSTGLHGFPDSLTVTGPYVNKTLFDEMGIELPGEGTTWEEWTEIAQQVAAGTGVPYAISVDRTGHRFAGPAISMGATLFNEDGDFTIDTTGYRAFAEIIKGWHEAEITPPDVWLVGDSLNSCIDIFKQGELVMCMSGSWQINGLADDIGDTFDWVVVPNPSGPGGSTGIAGGSAVVAFADTEHPEAVTLLMEFLVQAENYASFSANTLNLPAHLEVASGVVAFQTENTAILRALSQYATEVVKLQDQAVALNVHPYAFAYYRNSANRIGEYLTGDLALPVALANLQQDIDDAIAEAEE